MLAYSHLLPADVNYYRIPVPDVTAPSDAQVREALDLIEAGQKNGTVYLHCWGGCGRTGVIVGAYLVEHGVTPNEALERVQELTRAVQAKPCPETGAQRTVVLDWKN